MTKTNTSRLRRSIVRIVRAAILAYVAMLICLVALESRLLFPGAYSDRPVPHGDFTPGGETDGSIQTVHIGSLPCRLLEHPDPQSYVLFCHGNGIRASELDHWTRRLSGALDATVMAAEYRGFTDQETPSEKKLIEDCRRVLNHFCSSYALMPSEVIVYGRSLGGGCAAAIAAERETKILVLDRTFDAAWRVAEARFPIFPIRLLMQNRFDSAQKLADYQGSVVQIHGRPDEVIPIRRGRALFEAIPTRDKVWIEVPDLRHNDSLSDPWLDRLADAIHKAKK